MYMFDQVLGNPPYKPHGYECSSVAASATMQ